MATLAGIYAELFEQCSSAPSAWCGAEEGSGTKRRRAAHDADGAPRARRSIDVTLSLEELFTGCTKRLTVPAPLPGSPPRAVAVPISPGLRAGTTILLAPPAAPGGVAVVVREALHSVYRRVGDDLLAMALVPLVDALTGGRLRLRHLDGRQLEIPLPEDAVAQHGQVLSFKGEGMPCAADPSRRGNLHVRLQVQFPASLASLSDEQRAILRQALSA